MSKRATYRILAFGMWPTGLGFIRVDDFEDEDVTRKEALSEFYRIIKGKQPDTCEGPCRVMLFKEVECVECYSVETIRKMKWKREQSQ